MMKQICNWCARVSNPPNPELWIRADLRIDGLDDGSISWLPSKALDFCAQKECCSQIDRVERFLLEMPRGSAGIRVRLVVSDTRDGPTFYEDRFLDHPGAAEDVRAMARFFHETSHPKLRRRLEAFEEEGAEEEGVGGRGSGVGQKEQTDPDPAARSPQPAAPLEISK